jgi:hypothetical protein
MMAAGVMTKYHLHNLARVTAEHHRIGLGPDGKPENLLSPGEEPWNKWESENHNRSWVEIEFGDKLIFKGIGFKSAGDHPRKSPTHVKIFVWHLITLGWHEIAARPLEFNGRNWFKVEFPEIHGETKKVRFEFHNDRKMDGCQLGEIMFYHHGDGILPVAFAAEVIAQPQPTVIVETNAYPQPTMQPTVVVEQPMF